MGLKGVKREQSLFKQPRIGENIIQSILFLCATASILTTLGIILVLGSESLNFFANWGFINSNNQLVQAISAEDDVLELTVGGVPITAGRHIEIGNETGYEIMLVLEQLDTNTIRVQRGAEGTSALSHPIQSTVYFAERVSLWEFFTGTQWQPQAAQFGFWPLLLSTLIISLIALLVAVPIGLGTAIYLSEYAGERVRKVLKPTLELLAGVPTVVFGYFALTFMTPILRGIFGTDTVQIYNMASAGIVVGFMIIPTISTISEDALRAVPRALREASYGLGATRFETSVRVLLPAALSGIVAAFILAASRAFGETMIVALAAGAGPMNPLTFNPFVGAETITGHIARISGGDIPYGSMDYNSLFALGLMLFIVTFILNVISNSITRRFREVYQ